MLHQLEDDSSSSSSGQHCQECVKFWNDLRHKVGCNANSTLCQYIPWVSDSTCQQMIDAVCAAGCEADPSSCAYVRNHCGFLSFVILTARFLSSGRLLRCRYLFRFQVLPHLRVDGEGFPFFTKKKKSAIGVYLFLLLLIEDKICFILVQMEFSIVILIITFVIIVDLVKL